MVPLGIFHTRAGEFTRMKNPGAFTRSALRERADRLELMNEVWRELAGR